MAYRRESPQPVVEGGTGAQTLTDHGVLIGSGTAAITPLAAASTGQTLMGVTGADPSFTGSPSFSGSVTAGTTITATSGAITATSGNVVITSGNLTLPTTTSAVGQIVQNGTRFIHTYGDRNLFIGSGTGNFTTTSQGSVCIGPNGMASLGAAANGNTCVGADACVNLTTGNSNVAMGFNSLYAITTGVSNVGIGYGTFNNIGTSASYNIGIGASAGSSATGTSSSNIYLNNAGAAESNRLRIGAATGTGNNQLNASFIHGIRGITSASTDRYPVNIDVNGQLDGTGNLYLPSTTSTIGQILINNTRFINYYNGNTVVGSGSSNFTTTGTANVFVGDAIAASLGASANSNVAVGSAAMRDATTAAGNVAVGFDALLTVTTGNGFNTAVGYNALSAVTTGTNNISIGASSGTGVTAGNGSNILLNNAGAAESNRLRIGSATGTGATQLNASFIHGIRGITTANADAIAVLIDSAGQLGTVSSSIRFKENVQDLPETRVLELRPVRFNYKQDGRIGTGLIAEEVEQVMPQLVALDDKGEVHSVKYHDLPVLLLAEIQKLRKELDELKRRM